MKIITKNILTILLIVCEICWTLMCYQAGLFQLAVLSFLALIILITSLIYKMLNNDNSSTSLTFVSWWYLTSGARSYLVGAIVPSVIFFGLSIVLIVFSIFRQDKK